MGAAYAVNPHSGALTYWTQVLGAPSRRQEKGTEKGDGGN